MAQHVFIPFVDTDYICRKCGVVVANTLQMRAFIDHDDCIPDHDPRCAETNEAIRLHMDEWSEVESIPIYTPSTLQELKRFYDWLNSADPVKALWGIK